MRVPSWVYVVQREDGLVKIGVTTDPHERIRLLECQHGELYVWACVSGSVATERWLHQRWSHCRVVGEWFQPDRGLLDAAANGRLLNRSGGLCKFNRPSVLGEAGGEPFASPVSRSTPTDPTVAPFSLPGVAQASPPSSARLRGPLPPRSTT